MHTKKTNQHIDLERKKFQSPPHYCEYDLIFDLQASSASNILPDMSYHSKYAKVF